MIASIIGAILPLAIQIIMGMITRSNLSKDQKMEFLKWVEQAGKNLGSVKLHKYALVQIAELKTKEFKET